jgi:hypothetical protein
VRHDENVSISIDDLAQEAVMLALAFGIFGQSSPSDVDLRPQREAAARRERPDRSAMCRQRRDHSYKEFPIEFLLRKVASRELRNLRDQRPNSLFRLLDLRLVHERPVGG